MKKLVKQQQENKQIINNENDIVDLIKKGETVMGLKKERQFASPFLLTLDGKNDSVGAIWVEQGERDSSSHSIDLETFDYIIIDANDFN